MAKRNYQRLTAEDHRRHAKIMELVRVRIAHHEEKAREQDEARRRSTG